MSKIIQDLKKQIYLKLQDDIGSPKESREIINKAVYTGKDDPGQWSPDAIAIIHCESGIPSGDYDPDIAETWINISDALQDLGHSVFIESINPAVKAVYNL